MATTDWAVSGEGKVLSAMLVTVGLMGQWYRLENEVRTVQSSLLWVFLQTVNYSWVVVQQLVNMYTIALLITVAVQVNRYQQSTLASVIDSSYPAVSATTSGQTTPG